MNDTIFLYLENDDAEKRVVVQLEDVECELLFIEQPRGDLSVSFTPRFFSNRWCMLLKTGRRP